ncbi:helix-turn-helix domain-containing protein [Celerinatantimonas sp. YJH-8]|uniref:helix-turn-helix domain-containing protein n=1 Tax=Celerinatantimonas sp. YJH-8 TaxID=3228714 RepID=UPI0038C0E236
MSTDNTKFVYASAVDVLERMSSVLGTKTSNELATALGCSPQAVSGWRSRNKVPYSNCVELSLRMGISLDWLLTGLGPVRRSPDVTAELLPDNLNAFPERADELKTAHHKPLTELSEHEKELLDVYRSLDDADQQDVYTNALHRKRLRDLEQRMDDLEGK